jgi:hypothetical protein
MKVLIAIVILFIGMTSCNQEVGVMGHWRPAYAVKSGQEINGDSARFGDLLLNSDSTFVSVGLGQQSKQTEGWHNGATQKGKWNFFNDTLSLWIEGVRRPVKFKVLKLTKREMIMESEYLKSVEAKLIRLKSLG